MLTVCSFPYAQLAVGLPTVQRSQSAVVCRLSGELMHEGNAPTVLPDGNVYSHNALKEICDYDGVFAHPITGEPLRLNEMRKAFFL